MRLLQSRPDSANLQNIFVGRIAERSQFAQFSEKAVDGQSWAVLLEGCAGVGKTALLRYATPSGATFCVMRAGCDPGEVNLPFGLISQLLWRARCHITSAGSAADKLTAGEAPARVGARLLEMVYVAQANQPVAMIIDDLQWADPESAEALGYMLRRLDTARVLTVLAARTQHRAWGEWARGLRGYWERLVDDRPFGHRLHLRGLTTEEVAELAARFGYGAIPLTTAERLRHYTDGNPAFLRALLTELTPHRLTRADWPLPVPESVAVHVGWLLTRLPAASRSLLDALVVLDDKCPLGLAARVAGVADPVAALESLLGSELVRWWPEDAATPVQVRLPVQRDAVYRRLTPGRRRGLHLAAAGVVHGDARWAHRVAAAGGVDSGLARELELAAVRAVREGAGERAATMLLWSADLSEDRDAHERRLLAAAAGLIWSHSSGRAEALRPRLSECAASPLRDLILLALSPGDGGTARVPALLARGLAAESPSAGGAGQDGAGQDAAGQDAAGLAQATARVALAIARGQADQSDGRFEDAIARQVLAIDGLDRETRMLAECLMAETLGRLHGETVPALRALESVPAAAPGPHGEARPGDAILLWRRAAWRARAGDLTAAADDLSAALRLARGPSELDVAANMLQAYIQYLLGNWEIAAAAADQAIAIALSRGATLSYTRAHAVASCVAASSGKLAAAEDLLRVSRRWWRAVGPASDLLYPAVAEATVAQARGDHAAILAALDPLSDVLRGASDRQYYEWCWWWPLRVEALIGTGRLDEAERALAAFTAAASVTPCLRAGRAWLAGWLAHQRGDLDAARDLYAEVLGDGSVPGAVRLHDDLPLLRARLEHGYGRLLLAQRNRRGAVGWLRAARERYRTLGAAPFLARCDADLEACGLRAIATRSSDLRNALSTQEDRVARLVAQGLTNREVAGELYVSVKTVEFHLSNVFTKLGITSRRQLRQGFLSA